MDNDAIWFTGDLRELASCNLCGETLFIVYDQKLRKYCYECAKDMEIKNATCTPRLKQIKK